jgi:Mn2+/Fe2+ NRAMP family transporter
MESLLLEIAGLPLHPLVVHAAVVVIPVAALLVIAGVVWSRRRPRLLRSGVITSWVAVVSAIVASQSGEALGEEIGTPDAHEELGELLPLVVIALAVVASVTVWARKKGWRVPAAVASLLSVIVSIAAMVLVVLVGHSGAEATWGWLF